MGMAICRKCLLAVLTWSLITVMVDAGDTAPPTPPEPLPDEPFPAVKINAEDYPGGASLDGAQILSWQNGMAPYCNGPECLANREATPTWGGFLSGTCSAPDPIGYSDVCNCWTVRAGAIFLRRNSNNPVPIVTGTPSYTTDNLGFDYETGPLVSVVRHGIFSTAWDLETTYFGVHNFGAAATTTDLDSIATTPTINVGGVVPGRSAYSSRIDSVEVNLRRQSKDWLTLLGGFRWLELGDALNTDIGGVATHGINVNNHLYGFQLGADASLWRRGAFSLDGFGKAGVYANSSDSLTTTTGIGGALPAVAATRDHTAFVGEMALNGQYDINHRWSVRGGYQLLWLDGVALAPEQLDNVNLVTGASTVDVSQTAFYHGFTLAAQFVW